MTTERPSDSLSSPQAALPCGQPLAGPLSRVGLRWSAGVAALVCGLAAVPAGAASPQVAAPPGFTGTSGTLFSRVDGQTNGGFLDGLTGLKAESRVGYEVVNLPEWTPVTFHYQFSGSVAAVGDNASVWMSARFHFEPLTDVLLLHSTVWSVGWVDGPPFMGDFAGSYLGALGVGAAGTPVPTTWSQGVWDGNGTVFINSTVPLKSGQQGVFAHDVDVGLAGQVAVGLEVRLLGVSRPEAVIIPNQQAAFGSLNDPQPYLRFDDGSTMAILTTPVPEPATPALWLLGLGVLGWTGRRRAQAAGLSAA